MKQSMLAVMLMMVATSTFASGHSHDEEYIVNQDGSKNHSVIQDHHCQTPRSCTDDHVSGTDVSSHVSGGSVTGSGNSTIAGGAVTSTNNQKQSQSQSIKNSGNSSIASGAVVVNNNEAATPTETTSRIDYSGSYTVKNVPNVNAAALTSSNDTCMGSTSGGVAVAGFGFSLGSTWSDKNCLMLKNSREMWNMGFKAAAMARMCMDDLNKEALEQTGFKCPSKDAK